MILIEKGNKVDWNAIRAEYIGGGISQRKLADKHGVSADYLMQRANREGWKKDRDKAISKAIAKTQQKSADAIADNVTIAADIKKRLLLRLQRIEKAYPLDATEVRSKAGNSTAIFRIRDLTAAYKDLTEGMQINGGATNDLLESLIALERRAGL